MKKAQILSAIALAFALGVTPVIATVNTVSAFTVADADENIKGSATQAEVNTAVAAVKANYPTYNNMLALYDLLNLSGDDAIKHNSTADDLEADDAGDITVDLKNYFGMTESDATKITELKTYTAQIAAAVKAANNVTNYTIIANYLEATATGATDDAAFRSAVAAINSKFNTQLSTNSSVTLESKKDSYTATITAAVNKWAEDTTGKVNYTWTNYQTLYGNVSWAQNKLNQYNKDFPRLSNALKANGVLTSAGQSALAAELAKDNPTVSALWDIATDTTTDLNNYDAWVGADSVRTAMVAAAGAQDFASEYNYNLVIDIAEALQVAVPVLDKTEVEIAEQLVGYVAPEVVTIESADKNVTVTGKIPAGTTVKVAKSDDKVAAFGDRAYKMWNISLADAQGKTVTFEGNITVTIKVPEGIDGAKAGVYFVDGEGNTQRYASTYANGALTFTTNHLSLWAIVEDNGEVLDTPQSPDTGVLASAEGSASTTVAMVAGLATALTAAGAGVVAYRNARRSTRK